MFSKVDAAGTQITRDFLLIKKEEMTNPNMGLDRLRALGWNVGELRDVSIQGQRVYKTKVY